MFCQKLSQRIRNSRDRAKRKSTDVRPCEMKSKRELLLVTSRTNREVHVRNGTKISDAEYARHVKELKTEMEKPKPSASHMEMLLSESFRNRREYIASLQPQEWGCILHEFPCFEHIGYVSYLSNIYLSCLYV